MKFLSLYKPAGNRAGTPPSPEHMAEMGKLVEESINAGVLLATGGLLSRAKGGAIVRRSGSEFTVTDGPFTETKELIGGFAVLEAKSKEEAIELSRNFLKVAGDGETELHQIMEPAFGFSSR